MKIRLFASVALIWALSGCASATYTNPGGERTTTLFLQRGVVLTVSHHCTPHAVIYQAGKGLVAEVNGPEPVTIPLIPTIVGEREIDLLIQSTMEGVVVSEDERSFRVDRNTTTSETWRLCPPRIR